MFSRAKNVANTAHEKKTDETNCLHERKTFERDETKNYPYTCHGARSWVRTRAMHPKNAETESGKTNVNKNGLRKIMGGGPAI
jgi:hypothetical protein